MIWKNKKRNSGERRIQALLKKESINSKIVSKEIKAIEKEKENESQSNIVERLLKKNKKSELLKELRIIIKKRLKNNR